MKRWTIVVTCDSLTQEILNTNHFWEGRSSSRVADNKIMCIRKGANWRIKVARLSHLGHWVSIRISTSTRFGHSSRTRQTSSSSDGEFLTVRSYLKQIPPLTFDKRPNPNVEVVILNVPSTSMSPTAIRSVKELPSDKESVPSLFHFYI